MAYNSTRTGPEIDAAVQLLGEIQTIRTESNSNLATVQTLAGQVQTNATSAATSATTATAKATEATTKAAAASASASAASASDAAAASSKTTAQTASSSAQGNADAAAASAQAAAQSRTAAGLSELVAAGYAGQTAALNAQQTALTRSLAALSDKGQSLHLDFALKSFAKGDRSGLTTVAAFSDIITFTRASVGTYFDINGALKTAAANEPRFDYDPVARTAKGLLIEEQRTNLLLWSRDLTKGEWVKAQVAVSATGELAPSGLAAIQIIEDASNGFHSVGQNASVTAGSVVTCWRFLKAGSRSRARVSGRNSGSWSVLPDAVFDLATGVVVLVRSGSASIVPCGNGWYLCSVIGTSLLTTVGMDVGPALSGGTNNFYQGDGMGYILDAGGNFEVGDFATSEIPTAGTQVTRAADAARVNDLSGWFNAAEGTLCTEATNIGSTGTTIAQLGVDLADRILISVAYPGISGTGGNTVLGSIAQASMQTALGAKGQKVAYAYATDNFACAVNGVLSGTKLSGAIPAVSTLRLGSNGSTSANCYIKSFRYFPRRLSNTELQAVAA